MLLSTNYKRMAKYRIRAFGITKDILGGKEQVVEVDVTTVGGLKEYLTDQYPALAGLRSLFIAVNGNYADETAVLNESDEIALIPPVSGG
jgi:molybdopterin synthase sulfur carrier subunit